MLETSYFGGMDFAEGARDPAVVAADGTLLQLGAQAVGTGEMADACFLEVSAPVLLVFVQGAQSSHQPRHNLGFFGVLA